MEKSSPEKKRKQNRHFSCRVHRTSLPNACSNEADSFLYRNQVFALPGLTCCRTFDVISVCQLFAFLYRKKAKLFSLDMKLNNGILFCYRPEQNL